MRFDAGTETASGQISDTRDRVLSIEFHARSTNSGSVYFGRTDVTNINGREMTAGEAVTLTFSDKETEASVLFSFFYVDVPSGNLMDWTVILA